MARSIRNGSPSKIPASFKERTLRRLLPPAPVLRTLSHIQLVKVAARKTELSHLIDSDPVRFFVPLVGGQREFCECRATEARVRCFFAGNKGGKSTAGAIVAGERLYGGPLWCRDTRSFSFRVPARGCVFAEDFDSHREITIPTIESWFPTGFIKRVSRNPAGHIIEMSFANGSLLHFRTYDQGSDKAEGKDWDFVWCDEPPPRDIYTAVFRGLVVSGGFLLITATLLKETWLFDELEHPFVYGFEGSIYDNTWISDDARRDFLASLLDDERVVRETGRPSSLAGVVYKSFHDGPPFVAEPADLPSPVNCPIFMCVDPHERKPLFILWGYVSPDDEIIWFDWDLIKGQDLKSLFRELAEREGMHLAKSRIVLMDPNRGKATQLGGRCWQDVFEEEGYSVVLGDDDVNMGHTAVREYLAGPKPQMRFTVNCRGKHGPLYQMQRYSWDDWAKGIRMKRDVKEKPKDLHKDFPDLIRYAARYAPSYDALWYGPEILDIWRNERQARAGARAYV